MRPVVVLGVIAVVVGVILSVQPSEAHPPSDYPQPAYSPPPNSPAPYPPAPYPPGPYPPAPYPPPGTKYTPKKTGGTEEYYRSSTYDYYKKRGKKGSEEYGSSSEEDSIEEGSGEEGSMEEKPTCKPGPSVYNCNCGHRKYDDDGGKGKCKWILIFKAVSGKGKVFDDYIQHGDINGDVEEAQSIASSLPYRNGDIMDNWYKLVVEKVKIELYDNNVKKAWFLFNGIATTLRNWMKQENLIASPYEDLKQVKLKVFGETGDASRGRRFFISRNYDRCKSICAYLLVKDPYAKDDCPWDKLAKKPYFVYGKKKDGCSNFNKHDERGLADRFVISAKVCKEKW